jgi:hypothetical protein
MNDDRKSQIATEEVMAVVSSSQSCVMLVHALLESTVWCNFSHYKTRRMTHLELI